MAYFENSPEAFMSKEYGWKPDFVCIPTLGTAPIIGFVKHRGKAFTGEDLQEYWKNRPEEKIVAAVYRILS